MLSDTSPALLDVRHLSQHYRKGSGEPVIVAMYWEFGTSAATVLRTCHWRRMNPRLSRPRIVKRYGTRCF